MGRKGPEKVRPVYLSGRTILIDWCLLFPYIDLQPITLHKESFAVIFPNDVRKGELVNTADGTTFRIMDDKRGIRRQVQTLDKSERASAYVFDWHCRLSDGERITMPADYLKKASAIGRTISVNMPPDTPVLDPVPVKLGALRDAWKGAIQIYTEFNGKQTPVPAENDRTHQYPTDGHMLFDGSLINKGDVGRLLRRRQEDRSVTWEGARRIWLDNVDNATSLVTETGPAEPGKDGRPVTMLHDTGRFLCVYVDSSRFALASKVGKVCSWKAKDATSGIVGRDRDGQPTVVLMPIRCAT